MGVLNGIDACFESVGVNEAEQKAKLVSFNFDGVAVNMATEDCV